MKRSTILSVMISIGLVFAIGAFDRAAAQNTQSVEDQYWDLVKNSSDPADFQAYLREYPNGKYAAIARQRTTPVRINPQPTPRPTGQPGQLPPSSDQSSWNFMLQSVTTRSRQTDVQFLTSWQAEVKQKFPMVLDGVRFYRALSMCPMGCWGTRREKRLYLSGTLQGNASLREANAKAVAIKPSLQKAYCASGAPARHIYLYVQIDTVKPNFFIYPEDCQGKIRESDAQLANRWAVLTRKDFPFKFGDFLFQNAHSECKSGCEKQTSSSYPTLLIDVQTPNHTRQQVTRTQVEQVLKPILLSNYCKNEPSQRGFRIAVVASDMANSRIGRFTIRSTDCVR